MGYYADYAGYVKFKETPDDNVLNILKYNIECWKENDLEYSIGGNDKYYEDAICEMLEAVTPFCEKGEIEYRGEDGSLWRFIFKNNEWIEEAGFVKYTEEGVDPANKQEFIGQIIDVFDDVLDPKKPAFTDSKYDLIADKLDKLFEQWKVYKET